MSKIIITDQNFHHHLQFKNYARGGIKRNFKTHPSGCYGKMVLPYSNPLMADDEIQAAIKDEATNKNSVQDIRDVGNYGGQIPSLDQNGKGYCWAHSTTTAVQLVRAAMGLPFEQLSAYMVACIIKGYRDEGGWNAESLEFAAKNGIATAKTWPLQSMSRSNDTPAMRTDAARMKVCEWWDGPEDNTIQRVLATILLRDKMPCMGDFNWWSHSVGIVKILTWNPLSINILNSWGDTWSENGVGALTGSKAIPDSINAPRVTMGS